MIIVYKTISLVVEARDSMLANGMTTLIIFPLFKQ